MILDAVNQAVSRLHAYEMPGDEAKSVFTLIDGHQHSTSFTFRGRIRDTFGVPMRAELKADYLIRNGGDIRNLGHAPGQRYLIYRAHMRVLATLSSRGFAVVFDKTRCQVTF